MPSAGTAPVGVLLAAGRGRRYDPSGARLKLLAPAAAGPQAGAPLAVAAARNLRAAVGGVIAVVRPPDDAPQRQLHALLAAEGCVLAVNAEPERGIGSSLALGIRAAREHAAAAPGWLVALADMPAIAPATIAAVAAAIAGGAVTAAPAVGGIRGHPVGFAAALFDELVALTGDQGARAVLQRHPPRLLAVDDPGALLDIDTAQD